jgi:hypothetical protein
LVEEEVAAEAEPVDHVEDEEQERHRDQEKSVGENESVFGPITFPEASL